MAGFPDSTSVWNMPSGASSHVQRHRPDLSLIRRSDRGSNGVGQGACYGQRHGTDIRLWVRIVAALPLDDLETALILMLHTAKLGFTALAASLKMLSPLFGLLSFCANELCSLAENAITHTHQQLCEY
jgi:hypothetical protein